LKTVLREVESGQVQMTFFATLVGEGAHFLQKNFADHGTR
jgi:hypothetical protein